MRRRTLLAVLAGATSSTAGCTGGTEPGRTGDGPGDGTETTESGDTGGEPDVPATCPTSQGLDVEWPEDLDAASVEAFVEEYEHEYHRDVVVEYEPSSRLDSYELSGHVIDPPRAVGEGWELEYRGGGGIYRPTLLMGATTTNPPSGADVVPAEEIEDGPLTMLLEEAAETGEAEHPVDSPGDEVERYLDLLSSLSADFEGPEDRGDSDSLYADVDGTTVELTVSASTFHGDYGWYAWYYVDEQVVRRATGPEADPREGDLLECPDPA